MKYCLQIIGFIVAIALLPTDSIAQTSPTNRTQGTTAFEICDNGVDENGNGIDCADPDCQFVPICKVEDPTKGTTCSDGIDNDDDGLIDCADSDCGCPATETLCNDGEDNDGDGKIDCDDGDCKDFVSCFEGDCNNGVDDDGDGFFDHYDGDCQDDPNNPNDYIITKPDCEARPVGNVFDVNESWRSANNTANNRGMPVVADIDNDGTPEVINIRGNRIYILNGTDGSVESTYNYPDNNGNDSFEPVVVGDVDNDGYGEIFHLNDKGWLRAMDFDPVNGITTRWTAKTNGILRFPALADFNRDGTPELYYGNEIRNSLTGQVIVAGSHGTSMYPSGENNWNNELNGLPVAVDILPSSACATCDGLELVLGHVIYAVDIAGGSMTEAKIMDDVPNANKTNFTGNYHTKVPGFGSQSTSTSAVVDFNQDGYLDVIMSGAVNKHNGPSAIFFWDVQNNRASAFIVSRPASSIPVTIPRPNGGSDNFRNLYKDLNDGNCNDGEDCTWRRGVGSLNIANIDSDSNLECTFMSGSSLYAIESDMTLKWANHNDFWESTSGVTGTAVFDFDGDGASEIIYRDQVDLYVVSGEDGQVLNSQYTNLDKCSSNTAYEYPIVADVDGDGETEIIVSCSVIENEKYESATTNGGSAGHIRTYKASPNQFWVPARRIWNQYAYFNVNVNDNMTIPRFQQPHHLNFSQACNDGGTSKFSLNKFMNQSPRITFCGDLAFPASKLDFSDDGVVIAPPICPDDTFRITLSFENSGDYAVNQPIPFAFYSQNPAQSYGNSDPSPWLDTLYLSVPGGVKAKQRIDTTITIRGARGQFDLYVSMNDVGPFDKETKDPIDNATFYPLTKLNGTVRECDGDPTIITEGVDPVPFEIIVTSMDNRRCRDDIGSNSGYVKITDKDGLPLRPLSNYLLTLTDLRTNTDLDISGSIADLDSGTFIRGLDSATYSVAAQYVNNAFSCGSTQDTVTINRIDSWPSNDMMSVEKLQDVSSCRPGTADGEARVLINGVAPDSSVYRVYWTNEQNSQEQIIGSTVANLKPITYNISVVNLRTGCSLNDSSLTMDLPLPVLDTPTVVPVTRCAAPFNGSITARMQQGNVADFDFVLIQKSPVQDTTLSDNGVFTGLDAGIYELKAYDPNNDCGLYNEGITVTLENQAVLPTFTLTQVSPQTACDPSLANGHVQAIPDTPGTYSYAWYPGTVTSGTPVSTTADATDLGTNGNTNQLYTVVILDGSTGCTVSDTVRLFEELTPPTIDPVDVSITPRTYCGTPNGGITVSVGGNTSDYDFELYQGTLATGTPFATNPDGIFTDLDSVRYTIVAIDTRTGCPTPAPDALTVKVPDGTRAPVVVPTVTPQSSCDINDPNGAISVTADGSTSTTDYSFSWRFEDDTTLNNTTSITDLARGNYQLTVQDATTGCDTTFTIFVNNDINENATLTLVSSDVTDCTPYNGQVDVTGISGYSGPLSTYEFAWYEISESGLDSTLISGVTGPVLSGLSEGTYSATGFNTDTECTTLSQRAIVGTTVPQPVITIVPDGDPVDDCYDRDGVFKLDVEIGGVDVSGLYTYDWYLGSEVGPASYIHTGVSITGIVAGTFTIVATSTESHGCATTAVIDMKDVVDFLPVILGDPTPTHIEQCGTPTAGEVFAKVGIIASPPPEYDEQSDYAFYWFAGRSLPPLAGGFPGEVDTTQAITSILDTSKPSARGDNVLDGHRLTNLAAGEYTVVVYNIQDGCYASKYTEILQIAREPFVSRIDNQPATNCGPLSQSRLEVSASKRNGDTTPSLSPAYDYEWFAGASATGTSIGTGSVLSDQPAGQYTVLVTDRQTSCSTEQAYTILDERIIPEVTNATSSGANVCLPSTGSVTVAQVREGSTDIAIDGITASDYNFYLYNNQGDYNPASPTTNSLLVDASGYTFGNLNVGTYHLAVENINSGCPAPFLFEISVPDVTPEMSLTLDTIEKFETCTDEQEGEISVSVTRSDDPSFANATFNWYAGTTATGTPIFTNIGATSTVTNLIDGEYTVQVIDQSGLACPVEETFTILRREISPVLSATATPQTACDEDGTVQVSTIILDGNSESLDGYNYTWYYQTLDDDGQDAFRAQTGGSNISPSYSGLLAGTYFVEASGNGTNGAGSCDTNVEQVVIADESEALQVIDDFISDPIVACDPDQFTEGEIEIDVLNSTRFFTRWYQGDQEDPSRLLPNLTGIETNVQGLTPGSYTVRVTDSITNCSALRRYTIQGIVVPLAVFPSAQPQINCTSPDGAVGVTINGGRGDYSVSWYTGSSATGTPLNPNGSFFVDGLSSGTYTVAVTDEEDPSCGSVIQQIEIQDGSGNNLAITVDSNFPMTNCDQSNPNGQLSVAIEKPEDLFRYDFFWYQGNVTSGNPIAFGPTATNLGENAYTVVARDRVTGCISDPFTGAVITLLDSGLLPAPTVRMVTPVTHCTNPNGSAEAVLDTSLTADRNIDYEFIWSNALGEVIFSSDRTNIASQLDTGMYSVIARNTSTGCVSAPGEVYISDSIHIPEFEIVTTPSFCSDPSGTLKIEYYEPIRITNIEWVTPYGFNNGEFLENQPAGKYTATLTNANGCQFTKEAYVIPGIEVYNAVSPNGDQNNDIFRISCIEDFKDNLVQIYNRSGSLVYEHIGYDNETIFFNGFGNKGVYVGGKELPDGTYFYIVDKRNGDEPQSGYLELLR